MSAGCRTPRPRRDSWAFEGEQKRARIEAAVDRAAIAEALAPPPRLAVGGEEEWAECTWRWFGEAAVNAGEKYRAALDAGFTVVEVAAFVGVSRQAVYAALKYQHQSNGRPIGRPVGSRSRCSVCGDLGHDRRTCKVGP